MDVAKVMLKWNGDNGVVVAVSCLSFVFSSLGEEQEKKMTPKIIYKLLDDNFILIMFLEKWTPVKVRLL